MPVTILATHRVNLFRFRTTTGRARRPLCVSNVITRHEARAYKPRPKGAASQSAAPLLLDIATRSFTTTRRRARMTTRLSSSLGSANTRFR